jgi:hypothetical protein
MKVSPLICIFTLVAAGCVTSARAQDQASFQARLAARQELALAKIELRNYWQVEYPRQRRELDAAIELTEMALRNNESLLDEYQPFTQFSLGQPFPITIRNLQMCIRETELRLQNLRAERNALVRFHSDQFRALEMKAQQARWRVAELEANDVVASEPPANQPPSSIVLPPPQR